jgi:NADP-dependent 3-hydroxy acid dehydrogenase YdfG
MNNRTGQTVWITGASSGIGEALFYAFPPGQVELPAMDLSYVEELPRKLEWVIANGSLGYGFSVP